MYNDVLSTLSRANAFPESIIQLARKDIGGADFKAYQDQTNPESRQWRNCVKLPLPGNVRIYGVSFELNSEPPPRP